MGPSDVILRVLVLKKIFCCDERQNFTLLSATMRSRVNVPDTCKLMHSPMSEQCRARSSASTSSYIALWMVMRHGPHGWSCGFKHVTPGEKNNKRALPINFRNYPNFGCGKKRGPISLASRVAHLLRKHF